MPGIFLRTFQRFALVRKVLFFYIFDASGSFSLWSFIHSKHFLRFSHLDAGASYDEADVRRFFFYMAYRPLRAPAAMVLAHLTMGFALCNGEIPALLRCLLRSHTKYAPLFTPCKTRISLIALCKNE